MYVNNQIVGVVKYASKGLAYYDSVMEQIKKEYPEDADIRSEVYFKEIEGRSPALTSESQIVNAIEQIIEIHSPAYAIKIDGKTLCHVKTLEEAMQLVDTIKKPFVDDIISSGSQMKKSDFSEKILFNAVSVDFHDILSIEEALAMLQQSSEGVVEYTATNEDTFWKLANENNMSVEEIQALNPNLDPERIKEGDIIVLSQEKRLLNVVTEETLSYEEEIPFTVEERDDDNLLKDEMEKIQEGKAGKQLVEALVIRENGIETSREIIKETVVEEPINEIVAIGTKKPAPTPTATPKPRSTPRPTSAPARSSSTKATTKPTKKPASTQAPEATKKPASTSEPTKESKSTSEAPSKNGVTGQNIADYALSLRGKKYVRGGAGPNSFDCSGFTVYVYKHFGINIQRMAQHTIGKGVKKSELIPGDIVCFRDPGHVGIYIGNGEMVHASSTEGKVVTKSIYTKNYIRRYRASRRIIY
ncbi:MAG: LysM peptidoglycan-binding domain-containing protein [Clostridiales bacterium]|nr:LysM peptidoglycan-binding domain-containing protein [Clostridiales bacterium]